MPGRSGALILALAFALPADAAELVGSWRWDSEVEDHGGYSGIDLSEDGREGTVISDRGRIARIGLSRGPDGQIDGVSASLPTPLALYEGTGKLDSEGLAVSPDGTIWISLEGGRQGLVRYNTPDGDPISFPTPEEVDVFPNNRRLEGLAIASDGTLWAVPETNSGDGFRVFVFEDENWRPGPLLPAGNGFVPVGLDFDDEGRLYLLERNLRSVFGFSSRVRRFTLAGRQIRDEDVLLTSRPGQHDNLEGLAVWRDATGDLRLTMISDDNFFALQKTEIVEYRLAD
ncbi:esterase-like activity of phytase family protein [Palleronia abyssalis]|uniref:Phytase-like domain-containing protein n=1 Tax=Palleronia abyssalis TaxID=1501240 RepID=A0A2R8BTG6_9RHOB|nr:esterase-like activity of phytase family protein [Palleronia abyssalis]SPJ23425.1 hypothetical protein PAA8504_01236 [Palleronia abyssalis]